MGETVPGESWEQDLSQQVSWGQKGWVFFPKARLPSPEAVRGSLETLNWGNSYQLQVFRKITQATAWLLYLKETVMVRSWSGGLIETSAGEMEGNWQRWEQLRSQIFRTCHVMEGNDSQLAGSWYFYSVTESEEWVGCNAEISLGHCGEGICVCVCVCVHSFTQSCLTLFWPHGL